MNKKVENQSVKLRRVHVFLAGSLLLNIDIPRHKQVPQNKQRHSRTKYQSRYVPLQTVDRDPCGHVVRLVQVPSHGEGLHFGS